LIESLFGRLFGGHDASRKQGEREQRMKETHGDLEQSCCVLEERRKGPIGQISVE
jgi:hypothetical protein